MEDAIETDQEKTNLQSVGPKYRVVFSAFLQIIVSDVMSSKTHPA